MKQHDDIIAAIATPIGEGGISVIRISGKGCIELADKAFRGRIRLQEAQSHTVHFGTIVDSGGEIVDEVLVTLFRTPHSYTVEDTVEISCHGGIYVTRKVLDSVIASGARLAEPGEFTKRAFLNGRIDLSQAEAVADLIQSRSELALKNSLIQLKGSLSQRIKNILDRLVNLCGLVELELDFIEEGITLTSVASMREEIERVISELEALVKSFNYGKFYREGVKVVLVGRPNVGKSSLLNTLLDQNRAIVTEIPGTTRDVIEENILLDGILFRLVDTAGVRETLDPIEKEGVSRTKEQIQQADICLFILDVSRNEKQMDAEFVEEIRKLRNGHNSTEIFVGNKVDLLDSHGIKELKNKSIPGEKRYLVSAKTREGIDELTRAIVGLSLQEGVNPSDSSAIITTARHKNELENAVKSLRMALESTKNEKSGEFIAVDLRMSVNALGAILGTVTTDDILNNVFSRFCIGK